MPERSSVSYSVEHAAEGSLLALISQEIERQPELDGCRVTSFDVTRFNNPSIDAVNVELEPGIQSFLYKITLTPSVGKLPLEVRVVLNLHVWHGVSIIANFDVGGTAYAVEMASRPLNYKIDWRVWTPEKITSTLNLWRAQVIAMGLVQCKQHFLNSIPP